MEGREPSPGDHMPLSGGCQGAGILASLYDAMLDETRWPATSALIDEACGLTGNGLMVGEGPKDDVRALWVGLYARGQRRASQLLPPEIRR